MKLGEVNGTSNGNPWVVIGFDEICPPKQRMGRRLKEPGYLRGWGLGDGVGVWRRGPASRATVNSMGRAVVIRVTC